MAETAHNPTVPAEVDPEEIDLTRAEDEVEEEDGDDMESEFDDSMFNPMQQFTQLLVTEAGVPIVDVLQGIQEALEKQNKILFKLVSTIESKQCGKQQ